MNTNKWFALVFTLLLLVQSFWLFAWSAHVARILKWAAPLYCVFSITFLWWACLFIEKRRPQHKTLRFLVISLGIFGLGCLLGLAAIQYEKVSYAQRQAKLANVKVWDLHDETLFSKKENPFGVKLSFSIQFPKPGRFYLYDVMPVMSHPDDKSPVGSMYVVCGRLADPTQGAKGKPRIDYTWNLPEKFEGGVVYNVVFYLYPHFIQPVSFEKLVKGEDVFCLRYPDPAVNPGEYGMLQTLIESGGEKKFKVRIGGAPVQDLLTENVYNLKTFHDGFLRENPERCP